MKMGTKYVSIGQAAKELGVSIDALRAWHAAGVIRAVRTPGGHRRFDLDHLRAVIFQEEKSSESEKSR